MEGLERGAAAHRKEAPLVTEDELCLALQIGHELGPLLARRRIDAALARRERPSIQRGFSGSEVRSFLIEHGRAPASATVKETGKSGLRALQFWSSLNPKVTLTVLAPDVEYFSLPCLQVAVDLLRERWPDVAVLDSAGRLYEVGQSRWPGRALAAWPSLEEALGEAPEGQKIARIWQQPDPPGPELRRKKGRTAWWYRWPRR
jgi:hypothetical protein